MTCSLCSQDYEKNCKSHASRCNPCYQKEYYRKDKPRRLQLNREWRKNNPDKRSIQSWKEHRKKAYGLTDEMFMSLYNSQEGRCAICKIKKDFKGRYGLYVDHDHLSGIVRALLCMNCNAGLGQFKDNLGNLQTAVEYLKRFTG